MFSFLERLAWLQRLLYELTSFRALGSHKLPAGNRHGAPTPARWWLICHLRPISEWHLLWPLCMTVEFDLATGLGTRLFEPRVGFWSSLSHSRFDTS